MEISPKELSTVSAYWPVMMVRMLLLLLVNEWSSDTDADRCMILLWYDAGGGSDDDGGDGDNGQQPNLSILSCVPHSCIYVHRHSSVRQELWSS